MANNCLVTRLKATVNNPDLPLLNRIRFKKGTGTSRLDIIGFGGQHSVTCFVNGDYTASYNGNHQNETFSALAPYNSIAQIGISQTSDAGYFEFLFDDTMVADKFSFKPSFMECEDNFETLSLYSPYFLTMLLTQGATFGGNPTFSKWLNLVDENVSLVADFITTVNTYQTNVVEDAIDYTKFGKLINVTNITNLNTIVPATIAAAMVSNGRTSGTMQIITSVIVTVKFGSSMTNPTSQETAQGYQIS